MKKIIFLMAMLVCAISMKAQNEAGKIMIGGSLNLKTEDSKFSDANDNRDSNLSFAISPEVGYSFTDHWQIGFEVTYSLNRIKEYNAVENKRENTFEEDIFFIAPFFRYFCPINNNFSFVVKGESGFGFGKADLEKAKIFRFGVSVMPEIWIHATENMSLIGSIGQLGYITGYNKWDNSKVAYSSFLLNWSTFSLGVNYAF